ncbi:unnamed protein product [Effrenium voratum]|uniref:NmrA-like domain-containing protein n=1 Tax=Effrenium voratum TaxID=2562239 RepID=A0AA36JIL2_9DINO|nr:unnamed protein product [Effrenium voratum]CAJ1461144.1 unnamed protein product [Effrenium voratum]
MALHVAVRRLAAQPLAVVVPATSNSGAQAVRSLLAKGQVRVRAAARSAERASKLLTDCKQAELVSGIDAARVETVAPAFAGAQLAVIVTPHDPAAGMHDDAAMTANMINAARAAGVEHIVYIGSWTVHAPEQLKGLASRFVPSEKLLKELSEDGGPNFTSLRSGFFFQNYLAWKEGIQAGCVRWPNFTIPAVDPRDMGRAAAAVLGDPRPHRGRCYEISGPRKLTTKEVVGILSKKLGKEIKHEELPYDALTFLPPFLQELFLYMGQKGEAAVPFSEDTMKLCGEHTTFESWLDDGFVNAFKA